MAEPIKEDAWEESREPSSDIVLVPPPPSSSYDNPALPESSALLVCYNGGSGGSVRIQTSSCALTPAPASASAPAIGEPA